MDQVQYIYTYTNEVKEKKVCTIKINIKTTKNNNIKTATKTTTPLCFKTTWKECL